MKNALIKILEASSEALLKGGTKLRAGKPAHNDHGIEPAHQALIDAAMENKEGFFLEVIDLPEGVPSLMSALYGPAAGDAAITEDQVTYEVRGERAGPSRFIDKPQRPARKMVVIGDATKGVVYTAYGHQGDAPAPREWWDSLRANGEAWTPADAIESGKFWAVHALAK